MGDIEIENRTLFVVGPHRSGTSAATRVLSLLGAKLPADLMPAVEGDNSTGFWESRYVSHLNDRLLDRAGLSWGSTAPFPAGWDPVRDSGTLLGEAGDWGRRFLLGPSSVVVKDPRISRVFPFWHEVCRRLDLRVSVLLCLRPPLEVAASLQRRNGFDEEAGLLIWIRSILEAETASRGLPRATAWFSELLHDQESWIRRVFEAWGEDVPETFPDELRSFLQPELRHHEAERVDYADRGPIHEMASRIHNLLLDPRKLGERAPELDLISRELAAADRILGRHLRGVEESHRFQERLLSRVSAIMGVNGPGREPGSSRKQRHSATRAAQRTTPLESALEKLVDHVREGSSYVSRLEQELEVHRHRIESLERELVASGEDHTRAKTALAEAGSWAESLLENIQHLERHARELEEAYESARLESADRAAALDEGALYSRNLEEKVRLLRGRVDELQRHLDQDASLRQELRSLLLTTSTEDPSTPEEEAQTLREAASALRARVDELNTRIHRFESLPGGRTLWRALTRGPKK